MVSSTGNPRASASSAPSPALHASPLAVFDNDESSQSSASAPLAASSPLTDGDVNGDAYGDLAAGPQGKEEDTKRANARRTSTPSPLPFPSPSSSPTGRPETENLRSTLQALNLLCRGKHPASTTNGEHFEFTLQPVEYTRLRQFLERSPTDPSPTLDFALGLDLPSDFHAWARCLRLEYSPRRALLTVRTLTPVHQYVATELEALLIERFQDALAKTGGGGKIVPLVGMERHFWEPQREFVPHPPLKQRVLPRRTQSKQGTAQEPESGRTADGVEGAAETSQGAPEVEEEVEDQADVSSNASSAVEATRETRCPDLGLVYVPPDGDQDYFPGFILEVGYSHQLDKSRAKQYIRESKGYVRYVMAFNLDYNRAGKKRHAFHNVSLDAYHVVCADDAWFPQQCLERYDVRANATTAATPDGAAEADIGLRLSHLHETLASEDRDDAPITLPLQRLLSIVEKGFEKQSQHEQLKSKPDALPPPSWLRGKRVRTATPEDESAMDQNPDTSYIDSSHSRTSSKRRKTEKKEQV